MERIINKDDQPSHEVKIATMRGEKTGWDYQFDPGLIAGSTVLWSDEDWIRLIGVNWFRKAL